MEWSHKISRMSVNSRRLVSSPNLKTRSVLQFRINTFLFTGTTANICCQNEKIRECSGKETVNGRVESNSQREGDDGSSYASANNFEERPIMVSLSTSSSN